MPWGTMREVAGKKAEYILPQIHLVPRFVFRYNFKPPATNIYIIFLRLFVDVVGCHN